MKKSLFCAAVLSLLPGFVASSAMAQDAAPDGYVPTMTFDVASVHETPEANSYTVMFINDPHTSLMRLQNNSVGNMLSIAYGVQEYKIVNLPDWPWPAMFTVVAKSDAEADAKLAKLSKEDAMLEKQHMLQTLLADRFKLKAHWETRQGEIFNLVVAKGGSKMLPAGSMEPSQAEKQWMGGGDGAEMKLSPIHEQSRGRGASLIGHSCSMEMLVPYLASEFGRPVIDKTGLTGKFDFVVKYRGTLESERSAESTIPVPTLDRAIESDLGLKVEGAKGPVKVLVIDHIEKPTQN